MGDAIGADGVVLHPGSTVGEPHDESMKRIGQALTQALAESDSCPLLLEDTAGAGNTIGRTFEELGELVALAGGGKRVGICLDSCHLLASGYDVRTADAVAATMDACDEHVGQKRLKCLHVNDSKMPLRLGPRPPRPAGHRRDRRPRLRRVPVRAPVREPARPVRGPGLRGQRGRAGHQADARAAPQRAPGAQAALLGGETGERPDLTTKWVVNCGR